MSTKAASLKEEGNALFLAKKFAEAIEKYTAAIEATTDNVARSVNLSNRAQCYLSLERWEEARLNAAEALVEDPYNHKAWSRVGRGYVGSGLLGHAIHIYEYAAGITQDNTLASTLWKAARETKKKATTTEWTRAGLTAGSTAHIARAVKLKKEGDVCIGEKHPEYSAAFAKYTLALVFDPVSSVIYCDRASCAINLKKWAAAEFDARLSLRFDSNYARAWGCLGNVMRQKQAVPEAVEAFKQGWRLLQARNKDELTPIEKEISANIEKSLCNTLESMRVLKNIKFDIKALPWVLGLPFVNYQYVPWNHSTWYSSAWVIVAANENWVIGCERLFSVRRYHAANDRDQVYSYGLNAALERITNGLITDTRCFFLDRPNFFERYSEQMAHEQYVHKAFDDQTAESLLQSVNKRLRAEGGWGPGGTLAPARKSLSVTIRAWFLQAFISDKLMEDVDHALMLYKRVVDFLVMGQREWATDPKDERGAIFEPTFLLGVRRVYGECMRAKCRSDIALGIPDTPDLLERMKENVDAMLATTSVFGERERIPSAERPPGFVMPFVYYSEAFAHEDLGFYWYHKAKQSPAFAKQILLQSAKEYAIAAAIYPNDEEYRAEALWQQLVSLFRCGRPLRETLPICDKLEKAAEDKQTIWRGSTNAVDLIMDQRYKRFVFFAEDMRKLIGKGELAFDDFAMPDSLKTEVE